MIRVLMLFIVAAVALNLLACAASSESTKGADCNYNGQPLGEMPLVCQGSR